jgi:hypothetical protein
MLLLSFVSSCKVYPSQMKILEGGTKDEIRISKETLFKGVSFRFGPRTIEKSVENMDFIFCQSFQNLRLGSINLLPKDIISRTNVSCELDRRIVVLSSSSESKKLHAPQTKNFTHPKRRFWKGEQQMKCRFSKHFSRVRVLHMGH